MPPRFKHALCGRGLSFSAYLVAVLIGVALAGVLILIALPALV